MPKTHGSRFWCNIQASREVNYPRHRIGSRDELTKKLYSITGVRKEFIYSYDDHVSKSSSNHIPFHGGIFNLAYSADGSVLVAATERKSLLFFDPLTHKLTSTIEKAHMNSVNYVKFLDDRLFASCSDDFTVGLWDIRNTRTKLKSLQGHSYWVKNIEYDSSKGLLLSSSYDGCVNMWDINHTKEQPDVPLNDAVRSGEADNYQTEVVYDHERILYLSCIMRMRLTPDSSKMVICTSEGYIMVIHDLDLENLTSDLTGFQSDLYRLMQKGHSCGLDFGSWYNKLFTAKRNRVELISDFPDENEAHSITSLDVHPHSWSILSRNISRDENSEWSCVHDIIGDKYPTELVPINLPKEHIVPFCEQRNSNRVTLVSPSRTPPNPRDQVRVEPLDPITGYDESPFSSSASSSSFTSTITSPVNSITESSPHVSPVVIISARTLNRRAHATILNPNTSYRPISAASAPVTRIYKNVPRLSHYTPETNVGQGYIKELCFSADGRLVCSPQDHGYRILAFNDSCSELSDLTSRATPSTLHEVRQIQPHSNYVVTTKFSPTHATIASGCLNGRVVFSQPVL
ncbi:DDB1- and CUL4-associated factor 10 -like protein [Halotydeus destructor]|nr:DDB1- and CUL4-associated factor 10 -like protein [Halotydeus destructor]